MMEARPPISELTAEVISALGQLHELSVEQIESPLEFYRQFRAMIERVYRRAQQAGYRPAVIDEFVYPLVALADELAMGKGGALERQWSHEPLQLHFTRENVCGESFFPKLNKLREQLRGDPETLRIYYLCLLLGFRGVLGLSNNEGELHRKIGLLYEDLQRHRLICFDEKLAPNSARPRLDRASAQRAPSALSVAALLVLLASIAVYATLVLRSRAHTHKVRALLDASAVSVDVSRRNTAPPRVLVQES